ncbi:hypothetical protein VP01_3260g4 [Puccinia sorghi]|uniref:Uncharacterized protein n=1 Tax=Puccinia sorghi TaxID=27349 RepID=A0A0L6UYT6_9BASI|nr:hypothetical protein VP01_3260g4 [Puccinia sorghi]
MLVIIPFTTLVAFISCGAILSAPGQNAPSQRQVDTTPTKNENGMKVLTSGARNSAKMALGSQMTMGASAAPMSEQDKEAQEEAAENKPSLKTIANAMNELYFHDKYGSQRHESMMLLKMVGQAAGETGKTGDPEVVSQAMLSMFSIYNQGKPSSISASPITPLNKNTAAMEEAPSLKTIAHTLHESWEKLMDMSPKPDNAQLVPIMCQAISTTASSGDPVAVSKAIDAAYAKLAGK